MRSRAPLHAFLALSAIVTLAIGGTAAATWMAGNAANSKGRSVTMIVPAGSQPVAGATGAAVSVTWSATTDPPATGYVVRAYDAASGVERSVGTSCGGVVAALTCTESSVPDGTWRSSITPRVHAWVGSESARSDPVTVEAADPAPTALALVNGGGPTGVGRIDPTLDEIRITFSEPLAVSSICDAWSDDAADQEVSGTGVVVTIADNGGDNTLTVTANACTVLHIGTVALGADYLIGTTTGTFSGTGSTASRVSWDYATRTLVVHLGAVTGGTLASGVSTATATYTPDATITDRFGHAIITTPFLAAGQRF
jgi:hypothetical protein